MSDNPKTRSQYTRILNDIFKGDKVALAKAAGVNLTTVYRWGYRNKGFGSTIPQDALMRVLMFCDINNIKVPAYVVDPRPQIVKEI